MRPILAAILCAALGVSYGWALGADTRAREQSCRATMAETERKLAAIETKAAKMREAEALLVRCEFVTRLWHDTADRYQLAYLRGGR